MVRKLVCFSILFSAGAFAQTWEVGALGGFGFTNDLTVKNAAGSASAGLARGPVVGAFAGNDTYNYVSGEARYLYRFSDLRLSSGNTNVDFGGHTHIAEGVFLFHFRPRQARIRPFIAVGGGISVVVGTGVESAGQPLGRFAALTTTHETLPTADVGAGIKINFQRHVTFRVEADDFISGTPNKVIAPAPGASISGILHDVMAFGALSYRW